MSSEAKSLVAAVALIVMFSGFLLSRAEFSSHYTLQGLAIRTASGARAPLAGISFEIRAIQELEADQAGGLSAPAGEAVTDEQGRFIVERLSRRRAYLIRPVKTEYQFKPRAVVLDAEQFLPGLGGPPRSSVIFRAE